MHPRRSARVAELQQPQALLGPLEGDFAKAFLGRVLSSLPLDERLRSCEVCRGWRFCQEDASFWTRVDLSKSCGVNPRLLYNSRLALALLRAACVRAKGNLLLADLSGVAVGAPDVHGVLEVPLVRRWLQFAPAVDKASLRDLVAPSFPSLAVDRVAVLCRALPLCRVRCGVTCHAVDALPLLRREAPFALLTIDQLYVSQNPGGEQAVQGLASALSGYKGMEKLHLHNMMLATRAVVDALVDAAISAGINSAGFVDCGLSQTALPALGRLMQSPGFERVRVWNGRAAIFEGPALPAFCDALRSCKSLHTLELGHVNLWADVAAGTQLIAALEGLPSLKTLVLGGALTLPPAVQQAVGECLARLIERSTSLRELHFQNYPLGEAGLAPIFQTLGATTGLKALWFNEEQVSADFARDVVLPAVRANTSLHTLEGLRWVDAEDSENDDEEEELLPAMREVRDILEARRWADEEAA